MKSHVSIIIVSYNVLDFLRGCLESIYQAKYLHSFEVIVVDNASSDGSDITIPALFADIIWIQNKDNKGFAAANNQGIRIAKGDCIWLLNPDTKVNPHSMDELVIALENNPKLAACGSRYLDANGLLQPSCYPFPTLWREFVRLSHLEGLFPATRYQMQNWNTEDIHLVDNIQGASMMIKKEALLEVGQLDENYFMYTEEVDLNYRLKKVGWQIAWVPRSTIIHYGGQSTRQEQVEMFLQLYQTKNYFFRKHYGRLSSLLYKMILIFSALLRIFTGFFINLIRPTHNSITLVSNYSLLLQRIHTF